MLRLIEKYKKEYDGEGKNMNVYHYTSPDGLANILFNKNGPCLRFSQGDYLNDALEGHLLEKKLRCLINTEQIEAEVVSLINQGIKNYNYCEILDNSNVGNKMDRKLPIAFTKISEMASSYICCFSKLDDVLPMWNYYSKGNTNEGYCVSFNLNELGKSFRNLFGEKCKYQFFDVIYDESIQESILKDFLDYVTEHKNDERINTQILTFIDEFKFVFKQNAFSHEQEIRARITLPEEIEEKLNDRTSDKEEDIFKAIADGIRYRSKGEYIIPYFDYYFKDCNKNDLIKYIRIGPSTENNLSRIEGIKRLLKKNGYPSVNVKQSNIYIRY